MIVCIITQKYVMPTKKLRLVLLLLSPFKMTEENSLLLLDLENYLIWEQEFKKDIQA